MTRPAVAATANVVKRKRLAGRAVFGALEARTFLTAAREPSTYEQYLLELVNRARADPVAEAARLGIDLNEGLANGTIGAAAKQPLASSDQLTGAARDHVTWLRGNGKFQHEGQNATTPTQRIAASGFVTAGSWGTGENLGVVMGTSLGDVGARVETIYKNLFVDGGVSGRGHRVNLLNGSFESVGDGITTGAYHYNGQDWQAVLAGQDFAYTDGNAFLTGVAFTDALKTDDFYSPGEGMSGVVISARAGDGTVYSTTTRSAGGFTLQVPDGTYAITATNADGKTATYNNVVVDGANVKRDFKLAQFGASNNGDLPADGGAAALDDDGTLVVTGTKGRDEIGIVADADFVTVTVDGVATQFGIALVKGVRVDAGRSNDAVTLSGNVTRATVIGGLGDDTIQGGDGADLIQGGDGDDVIRAGGGDDTVYGGAGDDNVNGNGGKNYVYGDDGVDRLNGGSGRDWLYGGAGDDRLYGNAGNDVLDGGGNNDRCYGGDGDDYVGGGSGNDRLSGDSGNDTLSGGKGTDVFNGGSGKKDKLLDRADIESVLGVEVGA